MRLVRLGLGLLVVVAVIGAAMAIIGGTDAKALNALAVAAVLAAAIVLTLAAFPVRVIARAVVSTLPIGTRCPFDLERTLHVLIFCGTALVAVGLLYGALDLTRALLSSSSLMLVAVGPLFALAVRLIVIEPLKARVRHRLAEARQAISAAGYSRVGLASGPGRTT